MIKWVILTRPVEMEAYQLYQLICCDFISLLN
jgi:hypothetical protein